MHMQLDMPTMGNVGKMNVIVGADGIMWQTMEIGQQTQIMKTDMNRILSNDVDLARAKVNPFDHLNPNKQWQTLQKTCDFKVVTPRETDGSHVYVLEGLLRPATAAEAVDGSKTGRIRASLGRDDGFVRRMELYDKSLTNLISVMEFRNVVLNPDVPASTFVYKPPDGAEFIDMTTMFERQLRMQLQQNAAPQ